MQKIIPALTRLQAALDALESKVVMSASAAAALQATAEQCVYLRTEVSQLKKSRKALETKQRRAAANVDKALAQIDSVLGTAEPATKPANKPAGQD